METTESQMRFQEHSTEPMVDESLASYRVIPLFAILAVTTYFAYVFASTNFNSWVFIFFLVILSIIWLIILLRSFGNHTVSFHQGLLTISTGIGSLRRNKSIEVSSVKAVYEGPGKITGGINTSPYKAIILEIQDHTSTGNKVVFGHYLSREQRNRGLWFIRTNLPGVRTTPTSGSGGA